MRIEEKNGKVFVNGMDIQETLENYAKESDKLKYENNILRSALESIIKSNNTILDTANKCIKDYINMEVSNEKNN